MLPVLSAGSVAGDDDGGNDWPDQAGVFGGQEADPADRARAADFAADGAQGDPRISDRVSLRAAGSAATAARSLYRAARHAAGGEQQASNPRTSDGAASLRAITGRRIRRRLRQRAATCPRVAPPAIT